jgi:methionyl-tRNA formyltransferase
MTAKSKTIVFFGSGPVANASLLSLLDGFSIEAVITKSSIERHKNQALVEKTALANHIPLYFANTKAELDQLFEHHEFLSDLGVVVDYGVIISINVMQSFELGIINSHFSLLPEWRGADPITFSLLSGQAQTGVSLMLIDPYLDTGQLLAQTKYNIRPDATINSLTTDLIDLSNAMLIEYIPKYKKGLVKPYDQNTSTAPTYSRKISKSDGYIDSRKEASTLEREVRAYLGWPGSRLNIKDGVDIIIKQSHISATPQTSIDILCADKRYLCIDKLIAPSGRLMTSQAFVNGYLKNTKN